MKKDNTPKCFHCGSSLILVNEKTEKREGSSFSHTISTYRCPNEVCQNEIDRQIAKRIKLRAEKALIDKKRAGLRLHKKV